jgi:hypothetical protein
VRTHRRKRAQACFCPRRPSGSRTRSPRASTRMAENGTKSPAKAGLSYSAAAEHGMPGCISGIPKSLHLLLVQPH